MRLTYTENIIFQYLKSHISKVIESTVRELAVLTHTSTGSIERTVKKLGYCGFSEYRYLVKNKQRIEQQLADNYVTNENPIVCSQIRKSSPSTVTVTNTFNFFGEKYQENRDCFFDKMQFCYKRDRTNHYSMSIFMQLAAAVNLESV